MSIKLPETPIALKIEWAEKDLLGALERRNDLVLTEDKALVTKPELLLALSNYNNLVDTGHGTEYAADEVWRMIHAIVLLP